MVSGSLALLFFLIGFHGGKQGSGPIAWLDGPEGGTDGQTKKRTENLPILQDFVPYRGRCPAFPHENQGESRAGQGNR